VLGHVFQRRVVRHSLLPHHVQHDFATTFHDVSRQLVVVRVFLDHHLSYWAPDSFHPVRSGSQCWQVPPEKLAELYLRHIKTVSDRNAHAQLIHDFSLPKAKIRRVDPHQFQECRIADRTEQTVSIHTAK
jgi:hypothetical protein